MKRRNLSKKTGTNNNLFMIALVVVILVVLVYCWNNTENYDDSDCKSPYKKYHKPGLINSLLYGTKLGTCKSMGNKAGWCCK